MGTDAETTGTLVFDVGGTSLRAGFYSTETDRLTRLRRRPTPNADPSPDSAATRIRERLFRNMADMADDLLPGGRPRRVVIAFAGPVAPDGQVLAAPTVWGPDSSGPVDVVRRLRGFWPDAQIDVLNDVTAAAYRYLRHSSEDLCVVTVSSGIGNKVFIGGRPVTGPHGRGGEIGHWRVDPRDTAPVCDCGSVGHLGAVASGRATSFQVSRLASDDSDAFRDSWLGRQVEGRHERVDNRLLAAGFERGDAFCEEVVTRMARPLGLALEAIHLAVGVERFVIIGGFALALGRRYLERVAAASSAAGWDRGARWAEMLELGVDDDQSGLIGAGRFATLSPGAR